MVKYIDPVSHVLFPGLLTTKARLAHRPGTRPVDHTCLNLDLGHAPYVLYGVEYIDLVSLAPFLRTARQASGSHLDLSRAPYVLYGVKYTDLVSLLSALASDAYLDLSHAPYVMTG